MQRCTIRKFPLRGERALAPVCEWVSWGVPAHGSPWSQWIEEAQFGVGMRSNLKQCLWITKSRLEANLIWWWVLQVDLLQQSLHHLQQRRKHPPWTLHVSSKLTGARREEVDCNSDGSSMCLEVWIFLSNGTLGFIASGFHPLSSQIQLPFEAAHSHFSHSTVPSGSWARADRIYLARPPWHRQHGLWCWGSTWRSAVWCGKSAPPLSAFPTAVATIFLYLSFMTNWIPAGMIWCPP